MHRSGKQVWTYECFHGAKNQSPLGYYRGLAWLAERSSLAALHRVKGIKEETVLDWLREAAQHVERIEDLLLANYHLTRAQMDALWTYVGHKGEKGGVLKKTSEVPSGEVSQ